MTQCKKDCVNSIANALSYYNSLVIVRYGVPVVNSEFDLYCNLVFVALDAISHDFALVKLLNKDIGYWDTYLCNNTWKCISSAFVSGENTDLV